MNLDEIKQQLDLLNPNDLESIILFIKEKIISNKYIHVLLDALESRYSTFVCPFCGGTHIIRSGHYPNRMRIIVKIKQNDAYVMFLWYNLHYANTGHLRIINCISVSREY